MSEKLEASLASGPHHELNRLAGEWEGTTRVWFEPGDPVDESPARGRMRPVLDGRFILHEYTGSFQGKPLEGIALYGYHLELKKFQSTWIDSFHTGTSFLFSDGPRGGDQFNVTGSYTYVAPDKEHVWGWRTEINVVSDDEVVITAYNVTPDGNETKATETVYRRISN